MTLGSQFLDHLEHFSTSLSQPVNPSDFFGRSQTFHELLRFKLTKSSANVREVDIEPIRELGRGPRVFKR